MSKIISHGKWGALSSLARHQRPSAIFFSSWLLLLILPAGPYGGIAAEKESSQGSFLPITVAYGATSMTVQIFELFDKVMASNVPTSAERYSRDVSDAVCPHVTKTMLDTLVGQAAVSGRAVERKEQPDTGETDYLVHGPGNIFQSEYLVISFGSAHGCSARVRMTFL